MNIYNKLYYDISRVLEPDIRQMYSSQKNGIIKIRTKDYIATFPFTRQSENKLEKKLYLTSTQYKKGINLFGLIEEIGTKEISISNHDKIVFEKKIRECLFEVNTIVIADAIVDASCMEIMRKYFPHLEKVEFQYCNINADCSFHRLKGMLSFEDCEIENMRSFHHCESDISLLRVRVNKISPVEVLSKDIKIESIMNYQDINIYELFMKGSFPELQKLKIDFYNRRYSFEKGFFYLPFSAPNLEDIFIGGKVRNLDFLTQLKHMREISISSIEDEWGLGTAAVTDRKQSEKMLERNRNAYQIRKRLDPNAEKWYLVGELETERIIRLCHFLSFLNRKEDILSFQKEQKRISPSLLQEQEVNTYYEYDDGILYLKKAPTKWESFFERKPSYRILKNYLYEYYPNFQNQIVVAKDFIYDKSGIPILLIHGRRKTKTIEEAKKHIKEKKDSSKDTEEYLKQQFLAYLREYPEEDMPIDCFLDIVKEEFQIDIDENTFKNLEGSEEMNRVISWYHRVKSSKKEIEEKQKKYQNQLETLIEENYSSFTFQEKVYLYIHQKDNVINESRATTEQMQIKYGQFIKDTDEVVKNINQKTNGFYAIYRQYMKLTYKSYHTKTQEIEVKKSYIKKIKV